MKRYIQYITESNYLPSEWFEAIINDDFDKIKEMVEGGIDVNMRDHVGKTAIMRLGSQKSLNTLKYLLEQPGIDVNIQDKDGVTPAMMYNPSFSRFIIMHPKFDFNIIDNDGVDFIETYCDQERRDIKKDYELQKYLMEHNREDVILYFNEYNLVNSNIKKKYPDLFKAADWGLI